MEKKKRCSDCGKVKPLDDFPFRRKDKYWKRPICKLCQNKQNKEYYIKHREEVIKQKRQYQKEHPEIKVKCDKNYDRIHPEKLRAHNAVKGAIKKGLLIKQPCKFCESTKRVQGHHSDYSKPLEVIWLCERCHNKLHVKLRKGITA